MFGFILKTWLGSLVASVVASYAVFFLMSFDMRQRLQHATLRRMDSLSKSIQNYKAKNEAFPDTLNTLDDLFKNDSLVLGDRAKQDLWGNPIVYTMGDEEWCLLSYGADGKPGGVGLDSDIVIDNMTFHIHEKWREIRHTARPTLKQIFLLSWPHFQISCIFGGFCSSIGVLTLFDRNLLTGEKIYAEPKVSLAVGCIGGSSLTTAFFSLCLTLLAGLGNVS